MKFYINGSSQGRYTSPSYAAQLELRSKDGTKQVREFTLFIVLSQLDGP